MMDDILLHNKFKLDDYKVYKSYTAGIVLQANEVKDLLKGACSLRGSYVYMVNNVISILKMYIKCTEYKTRSILLKKSEIIKICTELNTGKILVPRLVFKCNNLIKLNLILCSKVAKYNNKKIAKLRDIAIKEARRYNSLKIKIS